MPRTIPIEKLLAILQRRPGYRAPTLSELQEPPLDPEAAKIFKPRTPQERLDAVMARNALREKSWLPILNIASTLEHEIGIDWEAAKKAHVALRQRCFEEVVTERLGGMEKLRLAGFISRVGIHALVERRFAARLCALGYRPPRREGGP